MRSLRTCRARQSCRFPRTISPVFFDGRHRGAVVVQVAILTVLLCGFAALAIDVGVMYVARTELQRTADAAALAAAAQLSDYSQGNPVANAAEVARQIARRNPVLQQAAVLGETDVIFGRGVLDPTTGKYQFVEGGAIPDAVRIRVRRTQNSANGPIELYFANLFGMTTKDMWATATAMLVPRDIAIVADLSGSHSYDSQLRHYKITQINNWEVWAALPGGIDDPESDPQHAGPMWGRMDQWGTLTMDASYDPNADPGLMHLPYNQSWSDSELASWLLATGYSDQEVAALMSPTYDSRGAWANRVAVALGLARWNSGMPGGLWEQVGAEPGNGNGWVGSSELTWLEPYPYNRGSWIDYINFTKSTSTGMYKANHAFRYKLGLKTFLDYLLAKRRTHAETPELAQTPTQPMQAVRDAVRHMVELVEELQSDDQMSLEIYAKTAHHEVDLTMDYQAVADRLDEMQPGHYDGWTCIGGGVGEGIRELTSERARDSAKKVMILLTDGNANTDENGNWNPSGAVQYALSEATRAAETGIRIYCVSVGADSDQELMQEIASIGQGEHFHASGPIEDYSAQLDEIFAELGGKRPVMLIE